MLGGADFHRYLIAMKYSVRLSSNSERKYTIKSLCSLAESVDKANNINLDGDPLVTTNNVGIKVGLAKMH